MAAEWTHWESHDVCAFGAYRGGWSREDLMHEDYEDEYCILQFIGQEGFWLVAAFKNSEERMGKIGPFPDLDSAKAAANLLMGGITTPKPEGDS